MYTLAHDGIEFVDFVDEVSGKLFRFNLTFFLSSYRCTYGTTCQGCNNTPTDGCCEHGTYIANVSELKMVADQVERLSPEQWGNYGKDWWSEVEDEEDRLSGEFQTTTDDNRCIFLNNPEHDQPGCALHIGALDAGEDFHDWKPLPCWTYPITIEELDAKTYVIGPIMRQDHWTEDHTAWWCIDDPSNYPLGGSPAYVNMKEELTRLSSVSVYGKLAHHCDVRLQQLGKQGNDMGMPLGGSNGRMHSVPVTITRKS